MDWDGRSTQLGEEEDEENAANLKAEKATIGVVKESAEDKEKGIEIKVKWCLHQVSQ